MGVADALKLAAARRALELVEPGMLLGVGTGTTARLFITELGASAVGRHVRAVPTSRRSAELARSAGIAVVEDAEHPIDLAVDGADEIDPGLRLVKGHGGALFREKIVAAAARRFVVIGDGSKLVERLGRGPVPVEVPPFLWRRTADRLAALGPSWALRGGNEQPFRTDNGNLILDLAFAGGLADPERTAAAIKAVTGVLEHGLFVGLARAAIVATGEGVRVLGSL